MYPNSAVAVAGIITLPNLILLGVGPPGSACMVTPLMVALFSVGVVNIPELASAFKAIELLTVAAKFGSSPNAAANSFNVSRSAGADETKSASSCLTKLVVANLVELSFKVCKGAVESPARLTVVRSERDPIELEVEI